MRLDYEKVQNFFNYGIANSLSVTAEYWRSSTADQIGGNHEFLFPAKHAYSACWGECYLDQL